MVINEVDCSTCSSKQCGICIHSGHWGDYYKPKPEFASSCCINCGQRDKCDSYKQGWYSDECRFYYPEELDYEEE